MRPREGLPWLSANMLISLDGKISTPSNQPAIFSSALDSQRLLELRGDCDVLLVGRGTWEADSMRMTVPEHLRSGKAQPARCVFSGRGRWNLEHPMFAAEGGTILLAHTAPVSGDDSFFSLKNTELVQCEDVVELCKILYAKGYKRVHCEGGGQLLRSLLAFDLLDELFLTWAGHIQIGGSHAPSLTGRKAAYLPSSRHFALHSMQVNAEQECFLHYLRN